MKIKKGVLTIKTAKPNYSNLLNVDVLYSYIKNNKIITIKRQPKLK